MSFQGKGAIPIRIHEGERFQIISIGPTPVSDINVGTGVDGFLRGLTALGYSPTGLSGKPDHIVFDYAVATGSHAGKIVRLGLVVPADFPLTPPGGPHVSPLIHPFSPNGAHPSGHIHESHSQPFREGAGGLWQYWSRPFTEWGQNKKTVAAYMSHIWRLWDSQ